MLDIFSYLNQNSILVINAVVIVTAFLIILFIQFLYFKRKLDQVHKRYIGIAQSVLDASDSPIIILDNQQKIYIKNKKAEHILDNELMTKIVNDINNNSIIEIDDIIYLISRINIEIESNNGILLYLVDITKYNRLNNSEIIKFKSLLHELKTPITTIKSISELMLENKIEANKRIEFISMISKENERLLNLLNDFNNEASMQPLYVNFNINELLEELKYSFVNSKNLVVEFNATNIAMIKQDKNKVKQILSNLLDNANKYTNEGFIKVAVRKNNNLLTFIVEDSGIGISENNLSSIYNEFYRVDNKLAAKTSGSGLGLKIVHDLVMLLDGKITIDSKVDKGTKVTIVLKEIE